MSTATSSELVNVAPVIGEDALTALTTYADAAAILDALGIPTETMNDYGTGFKVVEKSTLVGIPFLILQWAFYPGDFSGGFVAVEAITKHNEKVIFNDGSSGIMRQLKGVTAQRIERSHPAPQAGLIVAEGLVKTDYFYNETTKETANKPQDGKGWAPASTYYLAN